MRKLYADSNAIRILKDELLFADPDDYSLVADGSEYYRGLVVEKDDMENIYVGEPGAEVYTDVEDLIWVVSEERGADSWLELFDTKEAALRYAYNTWDRLSDYDQKDTVVEVRQMVNEFDYDVVWSSNDE